MKHSKKRIILLVAGLLCVLLVVCAVGIGTLQRSGWYEGTAEEGIAQYAGIPQENVLIHKSLQDKGYLYAVWEDTTTGKLCMTILEKQQKLGHDLFRPWGCSDLSNSTALLDMYQYQEGNEANGRSLIVVTCDNRDNTLDRCELVFTESGADDYTREWTEALVLTKPILLHVQWFPGYVLCNGTVFDK